MNKSALTLEERIDGAIIGGADETQTQHILCFAENLGLAFQVRDDILDVEGSTEVLGKTVGSDVDSGKTTFVSLLGIDETKKQLTEFTETAKSALDIFGVQAEFLKEFADWLLNREN